MTRRFLLFTLLLAGAAAAHVGSPDVYLDGKAGPYQLFITIRPPAVIPGVAELEVRAADPGIRQVHAVPLPMSGPGVRFAPVPDTLVRSAADAQLFSGSLWLMEPGSWQVRVTADGQAGQGILAVPVPAAALSTKRMERGLGSILACCALLLVAGLTAMAGAAVREARLPPGETPTPQRQRAGRIAMAVTALLAGLVLWGGSRWWSAEARSYGQDVYRPLRMSATLDARQNLRLQLADPGWLEHSADDFIPDHNHLMHLYAIREPGLDLVFHLHPQLSGPGLFVMQLPSMPAGSYQLYADVVHADGFPETLVSQLDLGRTVTGRALGLDEAMGRGTPWQNVSGHSRAGSPQECVLPDGYQMHWLNAGVMRARQPLLLRFELLTPQGNAPPDMEFYMGMLGHAAFVKTDGTVFAHIHPSGTVAMAALILAEKSSGQSGEEMPGMDKDMPGMPREAALPDVVSFPYGFPSAGRYRIFVQMKHGNTVETGFFDAQVT